MRPDIVETPRVLLDGLAYVESPRWHEGRLWFAHWGTGEVVAVDLDGRSEVVAHGPAGYGLVDRLVAGRKPSSDRQAELLRQEEDGSMVTHADRRRGDRPSARTRSWSTVAATSTSTVSGSTSSAGAARTGIIALVAPDGTVRRVAEEIEFPNGMVVTPDNSTLIVSESFAGRLTAFDIGVDGGLSNRRVWADNVGPDGICLDADGAIWTQAADTRTHTGRPDSAEGACIRVEEGGTGAAANRTRPGDLRRHAGRAGSSNPVHAGGRVARDRRRRERNRGAEGQVLVARLRRPAQAGRERAKRYPVSATSIAAQVIRSSGRRNRLRRVQRTGRRLVDDRNGSVFSNASAFGMKSTSDHTRITAWLTKCHQKRSAGGFFRPR